MIQLSLDEEERQALSVTLKSYLSNMSYEIANTDRMTFREELKAKRDLLQKVLDAVENNQT